MKELKESELKIYYNDKKSINTKLDRALEKTLKEFGYERWGSGINLVNNVRDLAFDKEEING